MTKPNHCESCTNAHKPCSCECHSPKTTSSEEWRTQRINMRELVEKFPHRLNDALDAAYLKGLEDKESIRTAAYESALREALEVVRSRLPNEMTEEEREKHCCEGSILFWGEELVKAIERLLDT